MRTTVKRRSPALQHKLTWLRAALFLLALLAITGSAQAVELSVGTSSGTVGDTVTVPVTVDDLTGLGVVSYELTITWSANYATAVAAVHTGTLSDPWGPVTFSGGAGSLTVTAAGATPLSGAGTLIELQFQLGPNAGTVGLNLSNALLNEGVPAITATNNGSLSVSAVPTLSVSPNSGEIAVGELLSFSSYGGTAPYTYTSSDPTVANFAGNMLVGLSPGSVKVTSEDAMAVTGTTSGVIDVRLLKLSVGNAAATPGDFVWVHINITNPAPYDIIGFSFGVTYNASRMTPVATGTTSTVLGAANWNTPVFHVTNGRIDIAAAGVTPLPGFGWLMSILFHIADDAPSGPVTLTPVNGLFQENYPPRHESGTLTITAPPVLTVSPDQPSLVAGDVQNFQVYGTTTPPLTWGVTNPSVGSIDASGQFTALAGGETRVFVVDSIGATDTTSTFQICDFYLYAPSDTIYTIPTTLPLAPDRDLSGLGIYGYELQMDYDDTRIEFMSVSTTGTSSQPWGAPVTNMLPGTSIVVNAGSSPLAGSLPLLYCTFRALPGLVGTSRQLTISKAYFNEGTPCAHVVNGTLQLPTAATEPPVRRARLIQNHPNPFNPNTTIEYYLPEPMVAKLSVYDASGARVADLADGWHPRAGEYSVLWDGKDNAGNQVGSGVYFYRLTAQGIDLRQKMVLLK